jgi:hypothetical protein
MLIPLQSAQLVGLAQHLLPMRCRALRAQSANTPLLAIQLARIVKG